jgi:hypothetical protein
MDKYINEDYSGCIEVFEGIIEDDNIEMPCDKAIVYTNIASAELGLEMARKCKNKQSIYLSITIYIILSIYVFIL